MRFLLTQLELKTWDEEEETYDFLVIMILRKLKWLIEI